ncbi:MAG: alpha/beta-hydrolase family protein [Hyphomicrobiales bacterium]
MTRRPPVFQDRPLLSAPHALGLVLGGLGYFAALTPSLIPRTGLLQGAVAGLAFASLYGIGAGLGFLWRWLGFPSVAGKRLERAALALSALFAAALAIFGLANATHWQNAIHRVMHMAPVESARPFTIAAVSLAVAGLLLLLGRLFRRLAVVSAARLGWVLPPRVAYLSGLVLAALVFWSIGSGVFLNGALRFLDGMYRRVDALIPPDLAAPADPLKTGSATSLISWDTLGAEGRNRVLAAPSRDDIAAVSGRPAMEPIRVYVGANSADTPEERASLALAELQRTGAFERAVLVIATPTGTGWVDPSGMAPVEFLQQGDIASVSVQYSYLPSWLSLLVQPEYGHETAIAVFRAVYDHWRKLPAATRPRLYLFGLSLGSLNSDLSADFFDIVADPYQGALWVGPPFASRTWRQITRDRVPGTPAWLPRFRDSSLFRFTSQTNSLDIPGASWGPIRMVYLQYASDPITFFEESSLYRSPDWLKAPRGPDVSPDLRWAPVVTFLQLICDMMTATTTPRGMGHVYAAAHYLDGWIAVTEPQGWSAADLDRLRAWFKAHDL